MKRVLALLLCAVMVLSLSACKKKDKEGQEQTTAPSTTTTTETYNKLYAHNEIINRFFAEYLAKNTDLDTDTIRRGKDQSEYVAVISECDVTITDVSAKEYPSGVRYAMQIAIEGGVTEKERNAMLAVFAKIAMTVDTSCYQNTVDSAVTTLEAATKPQEMRVSSFVRVASYSPIIENKEMSISTPCRMVLLISDPRIMESAATTTTAKK